MNEIRNVTHVNNVRLRQDGRAVIILDQSLLPSKTEYLELEKLEQMCDAIYHLKVRGAPAIGICAAYCMSVLAARISDVEGMKSCCDRISDNNFLDMMQKNGEKLKESRPTAVNLAWAVDRVMDAAASAAGDEDSLQAGASTIAEAMYTEAVKIHDEDISMCMAIAEYGLELVNPGDGILTHCNAGPLATSRYGTALGPILLGKEKGIDFKVFADETRPLLQGARITAYELMNAGVDVTLICDNMASMVMKNGWIQACFVGCDRVAMNGDTANKIGTSGVAVLAKHYGIPFYVLGPTSTIDPRCATGDDIPIELRSPEEIREKYFAESAAPEGVKCFNPAFDVTDHTLITAIITEKGICRPPFEISLKAAIEK